MSQFHNPYHFVPQGSQVPPHSVSINDALPDHISHANYGAGLLSGVVHCKLKTVTPLVIGGKHEDSKPCKKVHPATVNDDGITPYIPGNSIRGVISSIAEASSNSAMRVISDRFFSYRKSMKEALSAMGLIIEQDGELRIFPLARPHFLLNRDGTFENENALPKQNPAPNYLEMFPEEKPRYKIYFGTPQSIRSEGFLEKYSSYDKNHPAFYSLSDKTEKMKISENAGKVQELMLGFQTIDNEMPSKWDEDIHSNNPLYHRGILRVLGVSTDRKEEIPDGKKHEYFFPYSQKTERDIVSGTARTFPILPAALERFHALADEMTEESKNEKNSLIRPYTPHGQKRGGEGKNYRLKAGDIVFFLPSTDGQEVVELSLSSIWRGRVENADGTAVTLYDFLAECNQHLLPMGEPRKTHITPAELLFGYIEQDGKRALASRVHFSDAALVAAETTALSEEWIDLKVLSSPKPPSPSMYFTRRTGAAGYTKKSAISKAQHKIQGRKFYLHQKNVQSLIKLKNSSWTMKKDEVEAGTFNNVRVQVRPVNAGHEFIFTVKFTNLSDFELGMLCHALSPTDEFHHKLGMGKPLGLGTVKVTIEKVDKCQFSERYQCSPEKFGEQRVDTKVDWKSLSDQYLKNMEAHKASITALHTLGDPLNSREDVRYPFTDTPSDKSFSWFVNNDNAKQTAPQHLAPITANGIPKLKSNSEPPSRQHRR